jgi:hypothetical protein
MIYGIEYEDSGCGNEEELGRAAWIARHEAPLTGDKALLYADEQPACLQEAIGFGESEAGLLALLREHIAACALCNPAAPNVNERRLEMTIEEKVAVIIRRADAKDREAYEEITGWFYRAASRLKVKMPTRPFLVVAPRGIQARHADPDDGRPPGGGQRGGPS